MRTFFRFFVEAEWCGLFAFSVWTVLVGGCASDGGIGKKAQQGESLVLAREEAGSLAFVPVNRGTVHVRSTYPDHLAETVHYEMRRDYTVDYRSGKIRRTSNSRIPDFSTNMLYGVEDFQHGQFPGYGNKGFFVFVDYSAAGHSSSWPIQASQIQFLRGTQKKLKHGKELKIVAYGDSITAGGDATQPQLIFWQRWADTLQRKYPRAKVQAVNGATGGDSTGQGTQRLQNKVLDQHPDLVLIGFGMNDNNIGNYGVPVDAFVKNLGEMIDRIRKETGAEVILYSAFPPNPKWHYGSKNMEAYALATEKVALEKQCAFADVYHNWLSIAKRKKPEDLLGNNINHPNDYGHWIYFRVLSKLGL